MNNYIIIIGDETTGSFDTYEEALEAAIEILANLDDSCRGTDIIITKVCKRWAIN